LIDFALFVSLCPIDQWGRHFYSLLAHVVVGVTHDLLVLYGTGFRGIVSS